MPQIGERKTWPDGDVTEWDGKGWKLISSARLPSSEERQGVEHPHARVARHMTEWGLPTIGAVVGGKLGGPLGSGAGVAAGRIVGDALETIPELPDILRRFAADPQATAQDVGRDTAESVGTALALGAGTAAGERFLGPLLQKVPTISLKRILGASGITGVLGGPALAAKSALLGTGYNAAAKGAQAVGKGLEWLGTPFKNEAAENTAQAILRDPNQLVWVDGKRTRLGDWPTSVQDVILRTISGGSDDVVRTSPKVRKIDPAGPSPSTREWLTRAQMNRQGLPDEVRTLQLQIDDAARAYQRANPGRVDVYNKGGREALEAWEEIIARLTRPSK